MSILKTYLAKSISLFGFRSSWICALCADLTEAARTVSYVESVGNKADTLHKNISYSEPLYLKRAYEFCVRESLRKLNVKKVELAIDGKKDLYYGREGGINVRQIKHEHGADEVWEYIVLSIVYPIRVPLMAVPYRQGDDIDRLCIELLEFAKSLPLQITKVLFDRGFYHSHLIDYLESKKGKDSLAYLIFVPRTKAVKKYIEKTQGSFGSYEHLMPYYKGKSGWEIKTTIVVCKQAGKNKKGEPYDWVFATNLKPSRSLVEQYKRRWNIETGFRIMEEGKIKTKSNNPLIRLFYFLLRALFTLLWTLQRCLQRHVIFKVYLRIVERELRKEEVYKPPPIIPLF